MARHIGIIGCSAEGAALCYQTIAREGAVRMGRHKHPEIIMHTFPLNDYMQCIYKDDWRGVADLMIRSARVLDEVGADFLICPDNTIHQAIRGAEDQLPLPFLHIAREVVKTARKAAYKKLLILGTKYLMSGPVYPEALQDSGIEWVIPGKKEREEIDRIIFDELIYGNIQKRSKAFFLELIGCYNMQEGCDAAVLGCTEIPLIVLPGECSIPVVDSTRNLAYAAVNHALS